jgi:poly(A) polymerase
VPYLAGFENIAKVERAIGLAPDPVQRLAGLAVAIPEDAERLWEKLRLTNAEHARLSVMAENWRGMSPARGDAPARALLYRLKEQGFTDSVLLAWARSPASDHDAAWRRLATLPQRWTAPVFPLKAADFMARGVPQGPALGAALRAAEEAWIAADFPSDKAALEALTVKAVGG